jgi:hypothetical protein
MVWPCSLKICNILVWYAALMPSHFTLESMAGCRWKLSMPSPSPRHPWILSNRSHKKKPSLKCLGLFGSLELNQFYRIIFLEIELVEIEWNQFISIFLFNYTHNWFRFISVPAARYTKFTSSFFSPRKKKKDKRERNIGGRESAVQYGKQRGKHRAKNPWLHGRWARPNHALGTPKLKGITPPGARPNLTP